MNSADASRAHRPDKILATHLERWAIVYVRQSHPQQVRRHPESAKVQAGLRERALAWGWPAERIRVLDADQGRSGTTTDFRDAFCWLVEEIVLEHVGMVLGFQISRLGREDEACIRLFKLCAAFNTLLADDEQVYDARVFNDHMLLSFKGIIGGIELHEIQQRMQSGRLNRARRGEWLGQPPPGFVIGPDRKLQFDPDEQVQHVIRLVFEQFAALGTVSSLLRQLRRQQVQLPFRPAFGVNQGQLQWRAPQRESLRQLLLRPAYAGAYTWGRRSLEPSRARPGHRCVGRIERAPEQCAVFLPENHPAYISWDQYQSNMDRAKRNRRHGPLPGPARTKVALLAGLVVCGKCGRKMLTHYSRELRYSCQRGALDYGEPVCQSFGGEPLEALAREQVLAIVTPASLELSRRAAEECERQRTAVDQQWRLGLERASQDVARAFRQYNAVEPENRLVARTLERRWEEALLAERALREEYDRFRQKEPTRLTTAERAQIEALAHDLPAVWESSRTSVEEKRQVVRLLLHQVVATPSKSSQELQVHLHWSGGTVTEHQVIRTVSSWKRMADATVVRERLRDWQAKSWTSRQMAEELNQAGHRTPRGCSFTAATVRQLLKRGSLDESKATKGTSRGSSDRSRKQGSGQ